MSIASEIARLQQAKADLATSITNKGVTVPSSATLDDYPALVDSIPTSTVVYDAEIDYLSSTGTQYIDTEVRVSSALAVEIMVDRPISPASGTVWCPFGSVIDATNGNYSVFESTNGSGQKYLALLYGKTSSSALNMTAGSAAYSKSILKLDSGVLTYDNAKTISSNQAGTTFYTSNNLWIFGRSGALSTVKIYYAKIWAGRNLIRYFIPVRKNGVGYMYDIVSSQLFGNSGSGDFILGPDKT